MKHYKGLQHQINQIYKNLADKPELSKISKIEIAYDYYEKKDLYLRATLSDDCKATRRAVCDSVHGDTMISFVF